MLRCFLLSLAALGGAGGPPRIPPRRIPSPGSQASSESPTSAPWSTPWFPARPRGSPPSWWGTGRSSRSLRTSRSRPGWRASTSPESTSYRPSWTGTWVSTATTTSCTRSRASVWCATWAETARSSCSSAAPDRRALRMGPALMTAGALLDGDPPATSEAVVLRQPGGGRGPAPDPVRGARRLPLDLPRTGPADLAAGDRARTRERPGGVGPDPPGRHAGPGGRGRAGRDPLPRPAAPRRASPGRRSRRTTSNRRSPYWPRAGRR